MSAIHKKLQPPSPTDDETFSAPWMKFALQELGKHVGEHDAASEYQRTLYRTLAANNPQGPSLLDWNKVNLQLARGATTAVGPALMDGANRDVEKYLDTVRTDPSLDKKHRSFKLDKVRQTDSGWRMTAWCAAFVNWCLMQADATHLGYATAASWLKFGMPLAHPVYGCVVVVAPSSDTGSTTGHVAFYGGSTGKNLWLLGGNQGRKVSWMQKDRGHARGYRWPAIAGDYSKRTGNSAIA
ncbi:MAG TPA: TIGR02594 family protein [Bryobacteraceae bacterium]|jgi:uncharacterized protein (TIGR02594 family)